MRSVVLLLSLTVFLSACATTPGGTRVEGSAADAGLGAANPDSPDPTVPEQPEPVRVGGLTFKVEPREAEYVIGGGGPAGKVSELDGSGGFLKLDPGIYQVSLKCPGFLTWRAEVTVGTGPAEKIQVTMVPAP